MIEDNATVGVFCVLFWVLEKTSKLCAWLIFLSDLLGTK